MIADYAMMRRPAGCRYVNREVVYGVKTHDLLQAIALPSLEYDQNPNPLNRPLMAVDL